MAEPKLVRDGIPDLIRAEGRMPVIRNVTGEDKRTALRNKLQEEVSELLEAHRADDRTKTTEEIADVLEVIAALCDHDRIDGQTVAEVQTQKRAERGAFRDGIILESVKE